MSMDTTGATGVAYVPGEPRTDYGPNATRPGCPSGISVQMYDCIFPPGQESYVSAIYPPGDARCSDGTYENYRTNFLTKDAPKWQKYYIASTRCSSELAASLINPRPTWPEIWMQLAEHLSQRSTCRRAHVGCVIVSSDNCRVLSMGYNGNYTKGPNTCDSNEPGFCGCLHAEDNCLLKMNFNDPVDKIMYTTTSPCKACAKRIVQASINEVIYLNEYRNTEGIELLKQAHVKIGQMI